MLPSFAPVVLFCIVFIIFIKVFYYYYFESVSQITRRKTTFYCNKERFQLAENLRRARFSQFVISKVLAARMRKLITARARKNKLAARMLANARKDHSIPLHCNVT